VAEQFDDFVGTVAEDQVFRSEFQFGGQLLFQVKGVAVRIEIQCWKRLAHGGQGKSRRAERVLVRGELDDGVCRQAKFSSYFFDGTTRLVDRKGFEDRVGGEGKGHGSVMRDS